MPGILTSGRRSAERQQQYCCKNAIRLDLNFTNMLLLILCIIHLLRNESLSVAVSVEVTCLMTRGLSSKRRAGRKHAFHAKTRVTTFLMFYSSRSRMLPSIDSATCPPKSLPAMWSVRKCCPA